MPLSKVAKSVRIELEMRIKINMNQEEKEKNIKVLNLILAFVKYLELDRKLERKVVEAQWPDKKELERAEKMLDKRLNFDVPGIPLAFPLRRLMAKTKLHKDELIKVLNNLKVNGVITAIDITELQKPEMVDFDTKLAIDINREKLVQYKNALLKGKIIDREKEVLYLNQSGDLFKKPKEKYCYPMNRAKKRHGIIRYFAENKVYDYYPTNQIAIDLGIKENALRKEVGKINSIIGGKLHLKKDKILEGRIGSGYRINPKYKIVLKNG